MKSKSHITLAISFLTILVLLILPMSGFCQTKHNNNLLTINDVFCDAEQMSDESIDMKTEVRNIFAFNSDDNKQFKKEEFFNSSLESDDEVNNQSMKKYKNPGVAFALSFVVTGGGQFYNGETNKGVKMLGIAVAGVAVFYAFMPKEVWNYDYYSYNYGYWEKESGTPELAYAGLGVALATSIWSMVDAVNTSKRLNKINGFSKANEKPKVNVCLTGLNTGNSITPGLKFSCRF